MLKGIFDYAGTYLVNYAGFGMITDLRNDLYNAMLRRSAAFFQKHTTGTLLSTIINDIERVQFAMSTRARGVPAAILHPDIHGRGRDSTGRKVGMGAAVVYSGYLVFVKENRAPGPQQHRRGQDKLAEIQNILHETITGNRIVKAFGMENWEMERFRAAARRLFRANLRSVAAQPSVRR